MSIYSFGADSPLKFELTEEYAEAFNRGTKAFLDAQIAHKERTGSNWTPDQALLFDCNEEAIDAFNAMSHHMKEALERHGRPVMEEDILSDYLVKN